MINCSNEFTNPFEHDGATNLPPDMIIKFYIGNHNFSRFLESKKNIFLLGERGSGKTMHLLYHSFPIRKLLSEKYMQPLSYKYVGLYIPNDTTLSFKKEYELLESELQKAVLSEHFFVTSIGFSLAESLIEIDQEFDEEDAKGVLENYQYILGTDINYRNGLFRSLQLFFQKESRHAQTLINNSTSEFYTEALTFSAAIPPLLKILKGLKIFRQSHFLLLIDDAHNLNKFQNRSLNSWIAYRDHSLFSIKIGSKNRSNHDFTTSHGSNILDGHDFTRIDLESFFYNSDADFGKLAKDLVEKRLELSGITAKAEEFFPINKSMLMDLERCKATVLEEAKEKYPNGPKKKITDHVYKYARARYFQERSPKANLPPYSGFEIIKNLSTGVIRNLLEPCYWMYDKQYSRLVAQDPEVKVEFIPPHIQEEVIKTMSSETWGRLEKELSRSITGCSSLDNKKIYNFFDILARYFRKRLLSHSSEPRTIMFTISGRTPEFDSEIHPIFDLAREAHLIYERIGSAKDHGGRESYYIPNRILWPARGLDPIGQFARASIRAKDILSAFEGNEIHFKMSDDDLQGDLFNE